MLAGCGPVESECELGSLGRGLDELGEACGVQEGSAGYVGLVSEDHLSGVPATGLAREQGGKEGSGHAEAGCVFSDRGVGQVLGERAVDYGVLKVFPEDRKVAGLGDVGSDDGFGLFV